MSKIWYHIVDMGLWDLCWVMHVTYTNFKVGSLQTSSCIFLIGLQKLTVHEVVQGQHYIPPDRILSHFGLN